MSARILNGSELSRRIREQVAVDVATMQAQGRRVRLSAVLVGDPEDGLLYARSQQRQCERIGIEYDLHHLPAATTQAELAARLDALNRDPATTGIMLHMPLPPHIEPSAMQYCIDPYKDIEGVNPANIGFVFYGRPIIAPCTGLAVMELIQLSGVEIRGAEAVVVGQSTLVGKPVTSFLLQHEATVTGCHRATRDLAAHTRRADILVAAVGKARLIGAEHVKPGAVVIDVGINHVSSTDSEGRVTNTVVGDVDFGPVAEMAAAISPVPGGVGPVTVAILLRNTVEALRKQLSRGTS